MASIILPDEIHSVIEAEVREQGVAGASEYLSRLVREDQERRTGEAIEALAIEGIESGEPIEMTAESWRELRLELHRQAGIE